MGTFRIKNNYKKLEQTLICIEIQAVLILLFIVFLFLFLFNLLKIICIFDIIWGKKRRYIKHALWYFLVLSLFLLIMMYTFSFYKFRKYLNSKIYFISTPVQILKFNVDKFDISFVKICPVEVEMSIGKLFGQSSPAQLVVRKDISK